MQDKPILATKGLVGWHVNGRCKYGTYSAGPYTELPQDVIHAVDMSEVYEKSDNAVSLVLKRPNLDLSLPDKNVRSLFEGCVGFKGTTKGHRWYGKVEGLKSHDSVGLNAYLAVLVASGGKIIR